VTVKDGQEHIILDENGVRANKIVGGTLAADSYIQVGTTSNGYKLDSQTGMNRLLNGNSYKLPSIIKIGECIFTDNIKQLVTLDYPLEDYIVVLSINEFQSYDTLWIENFYEDKGKLKQHVSWEKVDNQSFYIKAYMTVENPIHQEINSDYVFILSSNATSFEGYSDYVSLDRPRNYYPMLVDELTLDHKIIIYYNNTSPEEKHVTHRFLSYFPSSFRLRMRAYAYKEPDGTGGSKIHFGHEINSEDSDDTIRPDAYYQPENIINGFQEPDRITNIKISTKIVTPRYVFITNEPAPSKIGYTVIGY